MSLGRASSSRGLGTVEFLVEPGGDRHVFIEAIARLQVEHTVTEAVTGLDLVRLQLEIAVGASLAQVHLTQAEVPAPRGVAVQVRINLETMTQTGEARPDGGMLTAYEPPSGPGIRVDGFGYAGYRTSACYDSLLAKLVTYAGGRAAALAKSRRALAAFKLTDAQSNIDFLERLLAHPTIVADEVHTRLIDEVVRRFKRSRSRRAGQHRHAASRCQRAGAGLVSEQLQRFWRQADEDDAGLGTGTCEAGILAEKAVAEVHRVRALRATGGDDLRRVQIRGRTGARQRVRRVGVADVQEGGVVLREDGDRGDAHLGRGAGDADGDLAAIGD